MYIAKKSTKQADPITTRQISHTCRNMKHNIQKKGMK